MLMPAYAQVTEIDSTVTVGKEYDDFWLTWTANEDNTVLIEAWGTPSGNAASWVTPQKINFGVLAPGETSKIAFIRFWI